MHRVATALGLQAIVALSACESGRRPARTAQLTEVRHHVVHTLTSIDGAIELDGEGLLLWQQASAKAILVESEGEAAVGGLPEGAAVLGGGRKRGQAHLAVLRDGRLEAWALDRTTRQLRLVGRMHAQDSVATAAIVGDTWVAIGVDSAGRAILLRDSTDSGELVREAVLPSPEARTDARSLLIDGNKSWLEVSYRTWPCRIVRRDSSGQDTRVVGDRVGWGRLLEQEGPVESWVCSRSLRTDRGRLTSVLSLRSDATMLMATESARDTIVRIGAPFGLVRELKGGKMVIAVRYLDRPELVWFDVRRSN